MNEQPDTGGPAFPTDNEQQTGPNTYHYQGATLRDYFAAKAMSSLIVVAPDDTLIARVIADGAYAMADAMLAKRSK